MYDKDRTYEIFTQQFREVIDAGAEIIKRPALHKFAAIFERQLVESNLA
jgi:hypothetical protein